MLFDWKWCEHSTVVQKKTEKKKKQVHKSADCNIFWSSQTDNRSFILQKRNLFFYINMLYQVGLHAVCEAWT